MISPLFKNISPSDLPHLLKCLNSYEKIFHKNETIFLQGTSIHHIGLVLEGEVCIIKDDYWGNHTIISHLLPGEIFGEAYACIPNALLDVSVEAAKTCRILFLDVQDILHACKHGCHFHHQLIQNLLAIVSYKNLTLNQKIDHVTKHSLREKTLAYLSFQAKQSASSSFDIPYNRQQLADYLCVDRSALSNELSKLQKEGIISFHKNHFTLHIHP